MNTLLLLGGGAAAVTAILLLLRTTWPLIRRTVQIADAIDIIVGVDDQPGICARLEEIETQLKPNDGKSLRDRVDYISLQVSEMRRWETP